MKGENKELLDKLKRISQHLDKKMSKLKLKKEVKAPSATQEAQLLNELECLRKLIRVYKNEKEALMGRLKTKTGVERVQELEVQVTTNKKFYEEKVKKVKEVHKQNKEMEKNLEKAVYRKEQGLPIVEVNILYIFYKEQDALRMINKETAKGIEIEQKIKQETEDMVAKEKKMKEVSEKASRIEKEVRELKIKESEDKEIKEEIKMDKGNNIDELKDKIQSIQEEMETESKKNGKKILELRNSLKIEKEKYREIMKVIILYLLLQNSKTRRMRTKSKN